MYSSLVFYASTAKLENNAFATNALAVIRDKNVKIQVGHISSGERRNQITESYRCIEIKFKNVVKLNKDDGFAMKNITNAKEVSSCDCLTNRSHETGLRNHQSNINWEIKDALQIK
ncbi:hypothetical protein GJ496_000853 [Pomphorhynchus laevis]|nr:hypothetical protein GJ496_000853 [Pomphorhynchus laevis]